MINNIIKLFANAGEEIKLQNKEQNQNEIILFFNYPGFKSLNKLNLLIKSLKALYSDFIIDYDINNDFILKIAIKGNFKAVYYFENYIKQGAKNKGLLLLGIDENGAPVFESIFNIKSLLIAGSSGSGKSSALHSLILSGLLLNKNIYFYMVDLKAVEFQRYNILLKSNRLIERVATDEKKALEIIVKFYCLIKNRFKQMTRNGARVCEDAPAVLVIDEYAQLFHDSKSKKVINDYISKIGALGRACNCFLFLATQHPTNENINNTIRANLQSRLALKCLSPQQSSNIIGNSEAVKLKGKGEALLHLDSSPDIKRIKCVFVSNELLEQFLKVNS